MKVRLDRLGEEPYVWEENLVLSSDVLGHPEVVDLGEVACKGRIRSTGSGFLLHLALSYQQTLPCTRCLREVAVPVRSETDLFVRFRDPEVAARDSDGEERELSEDDLGTVVVDDPVLDTRSLVIEQMELNVPMKFLCREGCAGICDGCGADLNAGPCDCRPAPDPRWSALAKWKQGPGTS